MKNNFVFFSTFLLVGAAGCASVQDIPKQVWGSSVQALERARITAESRTFTCAPSACFDAVLALTKTREVRQVVNKAENSNSGDFMAYDNTEFSGSVLSTLNDSGTAEADTVQGQLAGGQSRSLDLFLQDRRRGRMVVMGVPSAVDTTEVGIFFTSLPEGQTKVEVSSLSTNAKLNAAEIIFTELTAKFPAGE